MPNFPSFAVAPSVEGWEEEAASDPTIRSETEGGYTQTRPRFTRIRGKWTIQYTTMTLADKNTMKTFERTTVIGGSNSFTWTNPADSTQYTVRFLGTVKYKMHINKNYWDISFVLEEV
mgnify:CR=1 FL=1